MPLLSLPFVPDGSPVVEAQIAVSVARAQALKKAGHQPPKEIKIRCLVDTGASCTCVDKQVITSLGIPPSGQTGILTPSTGNNAHQCNQFDVSLVLIHPNLSLLLEAIAVVESDLSNMGIQALIGRDVLKNCLFIYNGQHSRFSLAF